MPIYDTKYANMTPDELVREAEATENALALEIAERVVKGEREDAYARGYQAGYDAGRADE